MILFTTPFARNMVRPATPTPKHQSSGFLATSAQAQPQSAHRYYVMTNILRTNQRFKQRSSFNSNGNAIKSARMCNFVPQLLLEPPWLYTIAGTEYYLPEYQLSYVGLLILSNIVVFMKKFCSSKNILVRNSIEIFNYFRAASRRN